MDLVDLSEIEKILDLMEQRKVVEFEYEHEGKRIKLRREGERTNHVASIAPAFTQAPQQVQQPAAASLQGAQPANAHKISSPLVGTFYRAPKIGAPPYVQAGDEVSPDKVVCIVESMKTMNEIKAQVAGKVKEILAKDGQAVEYGEALFLIDKAE